METAETSDINSIIRENVLKAPESQPVIAPAQDRTAELMQVAREEAFKFEADKTAIRETSRINLEKFRQETVKQQAIDSELPDKDKYKEFLTAEAEALGFKTDENYLNSEGNLRRAKASLLKESTTRVENLGTNEQSAIPIPNNTLPDEKANLDNRTSVILNDTTNYGTSKKVSFDYERPGINTLKEQVYKSFYPNGLTIQDVS